MAFTAVEVGRGEFPRGAAWVLYAEEQAESIEVHLVVDLGDSQSIGVSAVVPACPPPDLDLRWEAHTSKAALVVCTIAPNAPFNNNMVIVHDGVTWPPTQVGVDLLQRPHAVGT